MVMFNLQAGLESESEDEGPDLSLVPDPDKIYGPKADSDKDDDGENGGDDDENVGYVYIAIITLLY